MSVERKAFCPHVFHAGPAAFAAMATSVASIRPLLLVTSTVSLSPHQVSKLYIATMAITKNNSINFRLAALFVTLVISAGIRNKS